MDVKPQCIISDCTKEQVGNRRCDAHRARLRRHDPRFLAAERERRFRTRYGLSTDEAERIFAARDYTCWVCGCPWEESSQGLTIDHDHITGITRGALCQSCNTGLGHFTDDPVLLAAASEYLNRAASLRLSAFEETCA